MQVGSQHWTVASLATGAAALVSLLLAFATTHWLYMKEKCKEPYLDFMNNTEYANLTMYTNVGILQICTWSHAGSEDAEGTVFVCINACTSVINIINIYEQRYFNHTNPLNSILTLSQHTQIRKVRPLSLSFKTVCLNTFCCKCTFICSQENCSVFTSSRGVKHFLMQLFPSFI